ncbi:MAG: DUF4367 domain-containing protein [Clostridia bacterium]|nr:DUF4367 domain-containing protein [Clostridia bacterium]
MKNDSRGDVLDALLYASAKNAGENERAAYEAASPGEELSDREMKRIIRRAKQPESLQKRAAIVMKRAAVVVLVMLSVSFTCAMSVESVRESFWQSILEMGKYRTTIRYTTEDGEILPDAIAVFKEPYPGEDYVRREIGKSRFKYHIEFTNGESKVIYHQSLLKDYEFTVTERYDTGTPKTEKVKVNGCDGVRIGVGGMVYLNWHDNVYVYSLSGNVPYEELLRIAETMK